METTGNRKRVGRDLTEGSVLRGLLIFAVPIILTNFIQQLYSMADLMIIGRFAGSIGTVGVSTGGEISDFLTPVATSFATAGQIYIAQLFGAKNHQKLKESAGTFLSLMALMSVIFLAVTLIFRVQILKLLNCPPEAMRQAENYLVVTAIALPCIFGYNAVCGILRGMGESKRPLLFVAIAATVNIFLDLLLVAVISLEALGTAIATALSEFASFAAALVYLYRRREAFGFEEWKLSCLKIDRQAAAVLLCLGIPQTCRSLLVRVSMLWVNANVNAYGLTASATNSVGNKLQKFLEIFSMSLSQASAAMIAQNLGAKKPDRAKKVVWYSLGSTLLVATVISGAVLLWPRAVFGIFTRDPAVLEMGVLYLQIMVVHFFMSAVTSSFQAMVLGAGNAGLNFVIGVMDGIFCKIGFSLLFAAALGMGVTGYFWGTALSRVIPGVICIGYFYSNRWRDRTL